MSSSTSAPSSTSSSSSLSQELNSLPLDLPFLQDGHGKPVICEPLTFCPMTPDEGLEFLGIVVSEDGETRGINFVEALSKIEEARAEHEKDQPLSQLKLLNGAILAVTAPAALRTKFTGGKEAEDTSMNSSSVAIPSKAQHSPSHDSKLTRLEHSKQVKQQRVGHVEDLREGSSEIVLGQSEFARNFQAYDRLNSIFYETLINEIRHDFRATLPVEFYEIEGMMPSMLEPVFLGNHSSNRFSANLPQVPFTLDEARNNLGISKEASREEVLERWKSFSSMEDAPDRTTIAQGLGSLILLAVHGANGLSRSSALLHHTVNQEATRATRQVLQEAGLTLAGADEVIRDAILTRVGLDSEERREKEQKARRRESDAMKKKRKEHLAIIEGLRKELQEAKSEAQEREKVQDESSTAMRTSTSSTTVSSNKRPEPSIDKETQTENQTSKIVEHLVAQVRELSEALQREREENARTLKRLTTM